MNKNNQKNTTSKAKYQSSFDNFVYNELQPHLRKYKKYSKSQKTVARIIGTSTTTVESHYKRLREDPRFFVAPPNRKKSSKLFLTVTITFSYKSKSSLCEYLGENSLSNIYFNNQSLISSYITIPSLITHLPYPRARARDGLQKMRRRLEEEKRRRSFMMQELPQLQNVIAEEDAIPRIRVYPNEAILYADNAIKFAKPRTSAMHLFCFLANEYCRNNAIIPQWALWYEYKRQKQLTNDFPLLKLKAVETQKREERSLPASVNQSLTNIVSRKAYALFIQGKKSQFYVMRQLENFAQSYPQSESDWNNWIVTEEGKQFSDWIKIYGKQHGYTSWNPFKFDRENYRIESELKVHR